MKLVNCGCGGEAFVHLMRFEKSESRYYVQCDECGMRTEIQWTESEAITAWNKAMGGTEKSSIVERTAKVETVEKPNVYKCSECGQYFHSTAWGSPVEYCSRCGCRLIWDDDIPMEYFESGGI